MHRIPEEFIPDRATKKEMKIPGIGNLFPKLGRKRMWTAETLGM
jgi:hypothetical protein